MGLLLSLLLGLLVAVVQNGMPGPCARDHRRRLSVSEARILFERAGGRCQKCGEDLATDWHQAHLLAWRNGGATTLDKMEAWCPSCNLRLGPDDATVPPLELPRLAEDRTAEVVATTVAEWQGHTARRARGR